MRIQELTTKTGWQIECFTQDSYEKMKREMARLSKKYNANRIINVAQANQRHSQSLVQPSVLTR